MSENREPYTVDFSAIPSPFCAVGAAAAGLFTGIFFGSLCVPFLEPLADAFSMLLTMAVFPYLCLSLIYGLGAILPKEAFRLFKAGWPFLLGMWVLFFGFIFFSTQLIPNPLPAVVYADDQNSKLKLLESIFERLVPANAFTELSDSVIIVGILISLLFGLALMKSENREFLNSYFERATQIFERIFRRLIAISPIGIYAYLSIVAGSIRLESFAEVEYFWMSKIAISLFAIFFIWPFLLLYFTRIDRRQMLQAFGKVCLLPALAGSSILLVPLLVYYFKELKKEGREEWQIPEPVFHISIPMIYCLGPIGSSVAFLDTVYFSYFYRFVSSGLEKIFLSLLFIPHTLGSPTPLISSPFLEEMHLPSHALDLQRQNMLVTHYFLTLVSITGILTILLLTFSAYLKTLEIQKKKLFLSLGGVIALFILGIIAIHPFLRFHDYYTGVYQTLKIEDVIENPVSAIVLPAGETGTPRDRSKPLLGEILASGVLKVGVDSNEIPYSYLNEQGQLVGYDTAYAYELARDLDCSIEFVQVDLDRIDEQLSRGDYDLGMGSYIMSEKRLTTMNFSQPYQAEDNILIVQRSREAEFLDFDRVAERSDLTILASGAYTPIIRKTLPKAKILISGQRLDLIENKVDALAWAHTSGFVWCLSNPDLVVIDYGNKLGKSFFGYPIPINEINFASFVNHWIDLKEETGFKKKMTQYWLEGQPTKKKSPRWSILQNVLGIAQEKGEGGLYQHSSAIHPRKPE